MLLNLLLRLNTDCPTLKISFAGLDIDWMTPSRLVTAMQGSLTARPGSWVSNCMIPTNWRSIDTFSFILTVSLNDFSSPSLLRQTMFLYLFWVRKTPEKNFSLIKCRCIDLNGSGMIISRLFPMSSWFLQPIRG